MNSNEDDKFKLDRFDLLVVAFVTRINEIEARLEYCEELLSIRRVTTQ